MFILWINLHLCFVLTFAGSSAHRVHLALAKSGSWRSQARVHWWSSQPSSHQVYRYAMVCYIIFGCHLNWIVRPWKGMISLVNHDSSEGEHWGRYNLSRYTQIILSDIVSTYKHRPKFLTKNLRPAILWPPFQRVLQQCSWPILVNHGGCGYVWHSNTPKIS
jgi:hypothetical protein